MLKNDFINLCVLINTPFCPNILCCSSLVGISYANLPQAKCFFKYDICQLQRQFYLYTLFLYFTRLNLHLKLSDLRKFCEFEGFK